MNPWVLAAASALLSALFLWIGSHGFPHSTYIAGVFGAVMALSIGYGFKEKQ